MKTPCDHDAERSVIGSCLLDARACDEATASLQSSDFHLPEHEHVFAVIVELTEHGTPVDETTVGAALTRRGLAKASSALSDAALLTPSAENVAHYCGLVRESSLRRRLMRVAADVSRDAATSEDTAAALLDRAGAAVTALETSASRAGTVTIKEALKSFYAALDAATRGETPPRINTGFYSVDRMLGGLLPGALVVAAGRPGMGKTAFGAAIAKHVAMQGKPVLFVSLEMPHSQILARLVSSDGRIPHDTIRDALSGTSKLDATWFSKISACIDRVRNLPLELVDQCDGTVLTVRALARKMARERGDIGLVVVDYLQLMNGPGDNREQEIAAASRGLKRLALELGCPVLALAQLNRGPESRESKRPMLSDLRESGSIEQDADAVLFLYREGYYARTRTPTATDDTAEIIIAKNRHGESGSFVTLNWSGRFVRFDNRTGAQ